MSWFDTAWEHIAGEEEERELLMSAGVPALVVPLLADADTNVRLAALWTVINLTNGSALLPITIAVAALIVWAAQQCCLSIEGPRPIIKLDRLMRANAAHLHDCWLGDLVVVHGVSESIPQINSQCWQTSKLLHPPVRTISRQVRQERGSTGTCRQAVCRGFKWSPAAVT